MKTRMYTLSFAWVWIQICSSAMTCVTNRPTFEERSQKKRWIAIITDKKQSFAQLAANGDSPSFLLLAPKFQEFSLGLGSSFIQNFCDRCHADKLD